MIKTFLLCLIFCSCYNFSVSAKLRIPFGEQEKLEIVQDLPNSGDYKIDEDDLDFLELARIHTEFNVAWLPLWIVKEPRLVLCAKNSNVYYEIDEIQLEALLSKNDLNKEEMLSLGFYTKYGGINCTWFYLVGNLWDKSKSQKEAGENSKHINLLSNLLIVNIFFQ